MNKTFLVIVLMASILISCSAKKESESEDSFTFPEKITLNETDAISNIGEDQFLARPGFVIPMQDGSFVIGDTQTLRLHHFDRSNNFIASYGREGRGPGEFEGMTDFILEDDTLKVVDGRSSRITSYVLDGDQLTRVSIADFEYVMLEDYPASQLRGFVSNEDDSYLAIYMYFGMMSQANPRQIELVMVPYTSSFQRDTMFTETPLNYLYEFSEGRYVVSIPFYERGFYAKVDGYLVHAINSEPIIELYGKSGGPEEQIKLPDTRKLLSKEEKEAVYEERYRNAEDPNQFRSMVLSHMPDQRPAIRDLKTDVDNRIWVRIYTDEEMLEDWLVFNGEGEAISRLSLPEEHTFRNAKGNRVFLQRQTEEGPEIVISEWN